MAAFSRPAHVQLALDGPNRVVVTWDDARDSLPRVLVRVSNDGGETFGDPVVASDPGAAATFPVMAVHDGSITLAWAQQFSDAHAHTEHARPDMKGPNAQMPLPAVGRQQVVVRNGRINGYGKSE